jgi:hypothetical protein
MNRMKKGPRDLARRTWKQTLVEKELQTSLPPVDASHRGRQAEASGVHSSASPILVLIRIVASFD